MGFLMDGKRMKRGEGG